MRERKVLTRLSPSAKSIFRWYALHAGGPLPSPSQPHLSVCQWLAARVCQALWRWVVKEEGLVFSLSNDIESTMASRFEQGR